jgi:hypothetical protein
MPNPWVSLRRDQLIQQGGERERTIGKRAGGVGEKNSNKIII